MEALSWAVHENINPSQSHITSIHNPHQSITVTCGGKGTQVPRLPNLRDGPTRRGPAFRLRSVQHRPKGDRRRMAPCRSVFSPDRHWKEKKEIKGMCLLKLGRSPKLQKFHGTNPKNPKPKTPQDPSRSSQKRLNNRSLRPKIPLRPWAALRRRACPVPCPAHCPCSSSPIAKTFPAWDSAGEFSV